MHTIYPDPLLFFINDDFFAFFPGFKFCLAKIIFLTYKRRKKKFAHIIPSAPLISFKKILQGNALLLDANFYCQTDCDIPGFSIGLSCGPSTGLLVTSFFACLVVHSSWP